MANEVNVSWIQVKNSQFDSNGLSTWTPYDLSNDNNTLDFGSVQAGKVTKLRCVVARFSGASQVSDLQFWLDNTTANAQGSTNVDLSKWEFYYCIVPRELLNFNIDTNFTDAQKRGDTVDNVKVPLDAAGRFRMGIIDREVDKVPMNQFPPKSGAGNQNESLVLDIPADKGYADSHLIILAVQTPADANSGNTAGWFYRMNFLYN